MDDGFFSLAEFNAETEEAEGENVSRGRLGQDDDDDDDADDDVDFFAPVDDMSETLFEEDDLENILVDEDDEQEEEDSEDEDGRETIERLKDDLFAEEVDTLSKGMSAYIPVNHY